MLFPIGMAASQRGLPSLSLDFIYGESVDARLTTSGGAGGTRVNSAGTIVTATAPRFDYDPVTLAAKGLLVEEQRTNLLLNSLVNGTNLGTQSVTVTAQAYTLTFYGTGTVTLSGTFVGSLVGSGAYPTRSTLTFTPTAGTLTLTVSGTVQFANLEAGSFATSFIPTAGATVTRTFDNVSITGSNFSSWFNAANGTFTVEADQTVANASGQSISVNDGTTANRIWLIAGTAASKAQLHATVSSADTSVTSAASVPVNTTYKTALAYSNNDFAMSLSGATPVTLVSAVPAVNRLNIGMGTGANILNGHIRRLAYYGTRLPNAVLQALTV